MKLRNAPGSRAFNMHYEADDATKVQRKGPNFAEYADALDSDYSPYGDNTER